MQYLASRTTLAFSVLAALATLAPTAARAATPAGCKGLMKTLESLGAAERAARGSADSPSRKGSHTRVESLMRQARRDATECDWAANLAKIPELAPLMRAGKEIGEKPLAYAMIQLEVRVRSLLPDDQACHVANRTGKGSHRNDLCFPAQTAGVTRENMKRLAQGWCRRAQVGRASRETGIEQNKLAALFEAPDLPPHVPGEILEHWIELYCPDAGM